ncbi:hypothetical protein [Parafrankia sp. EUN1f]|uniref:hypothetical protein n=1 Tax=Parafrankia sp. EUN1f TaxID=102897 RepID=UPI0001C45FEA|nr:hypothetical protein [Parafrankia sp. EUN1f]EFC81318.1 hypothetical protein FrEUN1fDRAFT_5565 [Parafrankia sp. EUN1f]
MTRARRRPAATRPTAQAVPGKDDGSISVFLVMVLFGAALLFVALLSDQARVLHANAQAFDLAGSAARVGAQQLDATALADGTVLVDRRSATSAVQTFLAAHDIIDDVTVTVTGATVTVTLTQHVSFRIPLLAGSSGADVTQTRSATATAGP